MAQPSQPDLFHSPSNDYHQLPVTQKQTQFAQRIAAQSDLRLPDEARLDRRAMSAWIDAHRPQRTIPTSQFSNYPSSKQVAFAERIARIKRRDVPQECFRDKQLMSRWIDSNK